MKTTLDQLKEIIADKLGIEQKDIDLKSDFTNDLGADSLDKVELIMEIDKVFSIAIPDEEMEGIHTVQDALTIIEKKLQPTPAL